ncbi:hypothetical protein V6N11_006999 [Hibiscus sabdariffa]|uniref:PHD-type zinc finger plants domain-containing protein n=1 Tax=Hibiscus sabdariffa TaxID=183260 RepID=A0ABR2RSH7_9ROSI
MCGDVGFPDKLFRCNKCHHRFQHSYCSNYYSEFADPIELCDWCQSEERNSRHGTSSKKSSGGNATGIIVKRSEYSGDKIKRQDQDESSGDHKGKSSGTPSPRPTTRRKMSNTASREEDENRRMVNVLVTPGEDTSEEGGLHSLKSFAVDISNMPVLDCYGL